MLKFLLKKLDLEGKEPYRLSKRGQVGRILYHLLRTPKQDRQYDTVAQYPAKFSVVISPQMSWLDGCRHLTSQGIHDFNRQIEDMIEEEFINCLQVLRKYSVQVETKKYARDFMDLYGFTDEDFSPDALTKAYYRRRKALQNSLKQAFSIPNCPSSAKALTAAVRV
ncbi:hypothetical protein [Hymenobacter sp. BT491]|uniref:hypothetical protein n=1 Tax=Hymenobacter sp. BT491 TaxID=2766779 RepID=UPI001653D9BC|nr:hypothetical protein [Hymenobacter sp. BT491]MBC6988553.1 hypothetical protein [Hymenobacter sp. BT491]